MKKSYLLLILLGLLTALITGVLSFYSLRLVNQANESNQNQLIYQRHLVQLLSEIKDAETGQRGYIITGQNSFLDPYQDAIKLIGTHLNYIEQNQPNTEIKNPLIQELKRIVQLKLNEMEQVIQLRHTEGFDKAAIIVEDGKGKRQMDNIRLMVGQLLDNASTKIKQTQQDIEQLNYYALILNALSGLTALLLIATYSYLFYRDSSKLSAVQFNLNQTLELYRAILEGSKQILITTDKQGVITSLNKEAEKSLGYKSNEIIDQKSIVDFYDLATVKSKMQESDRPSQNLFTNDFELITSSIHYLIWADSEWVIMKKNGTSFICKQVVNPLRNEKNEIEGYLFSWQDLTEEKKGEVDLKKAQEMVEKSEVQKAQFLENLTHELKISVNAITNLTQLLAKNKSGNLKEQDLVYVTRLLEGCQNLNTVLNEATNHLNTPDLSFKNLTQIASIKSPIHALVIDDELEFRQLLTSLFNELGVEVTVAESGEEALKLGDEKHFDLITLDLLMDSMDGTEIAKLIQSHPKMQLTPIIVISIIAKKMEGKMNGIFAYLEKPVHLNELQELLQKIELAKKKSHPNQ